jgi:hypothetical protein
MNNLLEIKTVFITNKYIKDLKIKINNKIKNNIIIYQKLKEGHCKFNPNKQNKDQ